MDGLVPEAADREGVASNSLKDWFRILGMETVIDIT